MEDMKMLEETAQSVSRRGFIKGVIAAGAVASSSAYLFRGTTTLHGQPSAPGAVERLITLNVNGQDRRVDVMKQETLAMVLRYKLGLTGTKLGCDRAECGACTVLIDDVPHYSCSVLAHTTRGKKITTIEGLAENGKLNKIQAAWLANDVPQCGYCQSGMIMAATALLAAKPNPTDADIDAAMTNICRCGTYQQVREAIHAAAKA
jgi:aerobic-type carbon monoxide dehydrogenase small subunit (CoxS/CutS family)